MSGPFNDDTDFSEGNVEWHANGPGGTPCHAYARGPGQGDASVCGRVVLSGETHSYNYGECPFCRERVDKHTARHNEVKRLRPMDDGAMK